VDIVLYPAVDSADVSTTGTTYKGTGLVFGLDSSDSIIVSSNTYEGKKKDIVSLFYKLLLTRKGSVVTNRSEGTLFLDYSALSANQDVFYSDINAAVIDAETQVMSRRSKKGIDLLLNPVLLSLKKATLLLADFSTGKVSIKLLFSDGSTSVLDLPGGRLS
jgi:hypothetical protein